VSCGRILAATTLLLLACHRQPEFSRATVVLISVDTLRSDHLPAYGYGGVQTPNLDAFRRDSILFQRAYSHCPMTLPSHVSILTGLLPTEHGVRNNIGYRFDGGKFRTLADALRARGYRTGAAVSSYVLRSETGISHGFDDYDDSIPVAAAGAISEHQRSGYETLKFTLPWIERNAQQPFFFFFHIYEPHAPYDPSYDGEIAKSDDIVGRLLARLKSLGIYDRALIIFLSDHGEGLWDHGEDQHGILLYRESLQVPLMIKLPRSTHRGSLVARPVALKDVFPTVLDTLGIEKGYSWWTAIARYFMSVRKDRTEKYDGHNLEGIDRGDSGLDDREPVGLHHRSGDARALRGHRLGEQFAAARDEANAQIVSAVASRFQRCGHSCPDRRRKKICALSHGLSDRRRDEEDERDHARHRISRQPEVEAFAKT
jgi:hypothetical protein